MSKHLNIALHLVIVDIPGIDMSKINQPLIHKRSSQQQRKSTAVCLNENVSHKAVDSDSQLKKLQLVSIFTRKVQYFSWKIYVSIYCYLV